MESLPSVELCYVIGCSSVLLHLQAVAKKRFSRSLIAKCKTVLMGKMSLVGIGCIVKSGDAKKVKLTSSRFTDTHRHIYTYIYEGG